MATDCNSNECAAMREATWAAGGSGHAHRVRLGGLATLHEGDDLLVPRESDRGIDVKLVDYVVGLHGTRKGRNRKVKQRTQIPTKQDLVERHAPTRYASGIKG